MIFSLSVKKKCIQTINERKSDSSLSSLEFHPYSQDKTGDVLAPLHVGTRYDTKGGDLRPSGGQPLGSRLSKWLSSEEGRGEGRSGVVVGRRCGGVGGGRSEIDDGRATSCHVTFKHLGTLVVYLLVGWCA